ncbi:hypothetical protein CAPTEDRAFT_149142 [Capitella teleta]|uniref:Actin-interacting protein 1 n=2 Tax=Capitella teleta TaxID=283909 RepID=R7U0A9_CAPTE|nr:hypothetical protein CAPTEDRAFT_149142 [Capitella teleta]|eukprot:ELT96640.1 hypothetical protein CAPTEDRAFT_149142 [Capitella teleta]
MCVVGEGREKFGAVFNAETGASVGEIMGHSQSINSCDFRPQRPFRLVTASEDSSLAFFEGPPFKFQKTMNDHSKFVNVVRYAPNGEVFISGGSDGKAFVFDGKTGDKQSELGSPAHKGGIYALSFSADSARLLTVSGDKSAKVWDLSSMSLIQEIVMGKTVEDMLVGCLWQGNQFLTVSLSGFISYFDASNSSAPTRVTKGHNKPITAMSIADDCQSIVTGSSDGLVCRWNGTTGENDVIQGKGHSNQVQDMSISGDLVVTCGMDDMVMQASLSSMQYSQGVKMPSQPRGIAAASGGLVLVACQKEVVVMRGAHITSTQPISYEAQCVAIHPGLTQVAVGGSDQKVRIYELSSDALREGQELQQTGALTSLQYSPDGAYLAAADSNRKIVLYELPSYTAKINSEWGYHTAKVNHLAWTPDSQHLGSGSLDTQLVIWWPQSKTKYTVVKAAHPMSQVTRVGWLSDNMLVSSGQDSCLKLWAVTHTQ